MDLNTLFEKQMELDAHITQKRNLEGQPLLDKRIVALICELYECVNEARFFKFWSDNQKPRTLIWKCDVCGSEEEEHIDCAYADCNHNPFTMIPTNPLLEEYVDTIHFALSIANDLGYHKHEYIKTQPKDLNDLVIGITNVATVLSMSKDKDHVSSLINNIIALGYQLGFTEKEVIEAYHEKNKENYARQKSNY